MYYIRFDDGDYLSGVEDFWVMKRSDYLISTRGSRAYDSDEEDDDSYDFPSEWIGVRNEMDKDSIDRWARDVG